MAHFGIYILAGVLLISALNRSAAGRSVSGDSIGQVARVQLSALLSILVLAMLGLVPAATSKDIGPEVQRPLATVINGGLISTLIFTPLYCWGSQKERIQGGPADTGNRDKQ